MNVRQPPRLAVWLVSHLALSHQRDALVGDLFEEYQRGRSPAWYWKQALFVLLHAGIRLGLVLVPVHIVARVLACMLPHSVASRLRRATRRLVAVLAVAALGVGTLAWAATTYAPSCPAHSSSCQKTR
jgi:hypothetical protein